MRDHVNGLKTRIDQYKIEDGSDFDNRLYLIYRLLRRHSMNKLLDRSYKYNIKLVFAADVVSRSIQIFYNFVLSSLNNLLPILDSNIYSVFFDDELRKYLKELSLQRPINSYVER